MKIKITILISILLCVFACSKKDEEKCDTARSLQTIITNKPLKISMCDNIQSSNVFLKKVKFYEEAIAIAINEMLQKNDENVIDYKALSNYLAQATFDQCNDIAFNLTKNEYWFSVNYVAKFMLDKSENNIQSNQALCRIVNTYLSMEDLKEAEKAFDKMSNSNNTYYISAMWRMAPEYYANGNFEEAYKMYNKLNKLNIGFSKSAKRSHLLEEAKCAAFIRNYDEANKLFDKYFEFPEINNYDKEKIKIIKEKINDGTIANYVEDKIIKKEIKSAQEAYFKLMDLKTESMTEKLSPTKRKILLNKINKILVQIKQLKEKKGGNYEK